jgi:hypothetical protein
VKRVHIVARNYVTAKIYAQEQKLSMKDWSYVDRAEQLAGLENPQMVFLPGWSENKKPEEIEAINLRVQLNIRPTK